MNKLTRPSNFDGLAKHRRLLACAAALLAGSGCTPAPRDDLLLHCGAGLRLPVAEIVERFERDRGVRVAVNYDGSERLIGAIEASRRGDIFLPGDKHYVDVLAEKGLVRERATLCRLVPVILVRRTSPHPIEGLEDLLKPGVKLGLGDERACAIGQTSRRIFEKNGIAWTGVLDRLSFNAGKVDELGQHIEVGSLDAAIVWDATARPYEKAGRVVPIPGDRNVISTVEAAVLSGARDETLARAFLQALSAPAAKAIFEKHGFQATLPEEPRE